MIKYCEISDLEIRYGKKRTEILLTDPENPDATSEAIFDSALIDAMAEVDSHARKRRRNLPFDPVPDKIKTVTVDITVYFLHRGRDYSEIAEWAAKRYDDSIAWLESFGQGKVDLDVPDNPEDQEDDSIIAVDGKPQYFNRRSY